MCYVNPNYKDLKNMLNMTLLVVDYIKVVFSKTGTSSFL
jgi:hypothetical protein